MTHSQAVVVMMHCFGGSGNDSLSGGEGVDDLLGEAGDDVLSGDAGNDFLFGGTGNDQLDGGAGNDQLIGNEDDDILSGGEGDDSLFGGDGIDILTGGAGADTLEGGTGGDTLDGGDGSDQLLGQSGDDIIEGGLGHDTYTYRSGDGHDIITDAGAYDTILILNGSIQATTTISTNGDDLVITFDPSNSITIINGAIATSIDALVFSDGRTLTAENFLSGADSGQYFNVESITGVNIKTGTAGNDIFALNGTVDILDGGSGDDVYFFNLGTSSKRITDVSGNDTIVFGDGITVDDIDPQLQDGKLTIVVADDQIEINDWDNNQIERFVFSDGTELSAGDFGLLINHAPELVTGLNDQTIDEDAPFIFQIPVDTFADSDVSDTLFFSATLANGDALPFWLTLDPVTGTFTGTPLNADVASLDIEVTVTDSGGLLVTDAFTLDVNNINDAPEVAFALPDRNATENFQFEYKIQDGSIVDPDVGDSLTYTATLSDDSALPTWLSFDAATQTFSGVPATADIGTVSVKVTATDLSGVSVIDEFELNVDSASNKTFVTRITSPSSIPPFNTGFATRSVSNAGDINHDGFDDILIGGSIDQDDLEPTSPRSYIIYGKEGGVGETFSLMELNGSNGFELIGQIANDGRDTLVVTGLSDINGDGIADFGISSINFNRAHVIFGKNSDFNASFSVDTLDGSNGFRIDGVGISVPDDDRIETSGNSITSAGDFNGDGLSDILVGARGVLSSEVHVIFGQADGFNSAVSVDDLNGSNGFSISDDDDLELIGTSIANAGDVNGDGFDDIIIGSSTGQYYVVFGKSDGLASDLDVSSMNGTNGFIINGGISTGDEDQAVASVGDINDDGFDDLAIIDENTSFIIFGHGGSFINTFELASIDGTNGFIINARNRNIGTAGDIDADGIDDLVFSSSNGLAYVVFGKSDGFTDFLELSDITGLTGFSITTPHNIISVSSAGDINGDGFDDLVFAAPVFRGTDEGFIVHGRDFRHKADFVGSDGDDIVNVENNDVFIYTLDGNDQININAGGNATVNAGSGNDTFNINVAGQQSSTFTLRGGSGSDRYNIAVPSGSLSGLFGISIQDTFGSNTLTYNSSGGGVVSPTLGLGSLKLTFADSNVEVHLESFDPNDVLGGPRDIEFFEFNGATFTYEQLINLGFDIDGTENNDLLTGTNVVDRINGLAGDDVIESGDGNDTLTGGLGNDQLEGGAGDDTYIFNLGDGQDTINDISGNDQVSFGAGIGVADLSVSKAGNDLILGMNGDNSITIIDWFLDNNQYIERFVFADGTELSVADIEALIVSNQAPVVDAGIRDQTTDEDVAFSFTLPADAFSDPDSGDTLTYSATLVGGAALPAWMSFDAATQTFSGTPDNDDVGNFDVEVTVNDNEGETASDVFSLFINNVNDAPVLSNAITDQFTDEDQSFSFTVPANSFSDDDAIHGDALSYSASLADDSALPSWLTFDTATQTFSGTPDNNDVGNIDVEVTVNDNEGETASDVFSLFINNVNDAPVVSNAITDQITDEDQPFSFTVPATTFADDDSIHGDTLSYSASLADDSALPSWLTFDAAIQTFSGTPDNDDVDVIEIKVTATDNSGVSATDSFSLTINNVNDAPVVSNAIDDQATQEGETFTYQLSTGTFHDDDAIHGDTLKYNVTLDDGSALPDWLGFDAATQTLSGLVPFNASGELAIQITATDIEGLSTSDTFTLDITNVINGNHLPNRLIGTEAKDIINGFGRSDWLFGYGGDDVLNGQRGNDHLFGGEGNDVLNGDNGNDWLFGNWGDDVLNGGNGNDHLQEWYGDNILNGGNGNDSLKGGQGDDQLFGGAGNDRLKDWYGDNLLDGGDGKDKLYGGYGDDQLFGGAGNDNLEDWMGTMSLMVVTDMTICSVALATTD